MTGRDPAFAASPSSPCGSRPSGLQSGVGFTPGPWKLEKWQSGALYVGYGRVGRAGIDGIVADWPDAGDYTAEFQAKLEANARLIAAAPELYALAERAMHWFADNQCAGDLAWEIGEALAKARGESA
jgi:hypothetical protein